MTKRLEHELEALRKRMHILEGFEKVFDALDEIIKIIRESEGKDDAAEKIMKRFELDADQTDAILELKLYRLARLEILVIQNELAEKRATIAPDHRPAPKRGRSLETRSRRARRDPRRTYGKGDKRRSRIASAEEVAFTEDDFIVEEDNVVIISRDGWVKRQKEVHDLSTTRLREGDAGLAVLPAARGPPVVLFSNFGTRLHVPHRRCARIDRLRRADSEAVQVARCGAGDRGVQPRSAGRGRHQDAQGG